MVTSAVFNLCFVALWATSYGERAKMKRFLSGYEHPGHAAADAVTTTTTVVAAEVSETVQTRRDPDDDD